MTTENEVMKKLVERHAISVALRDQAADIAKITSEAHSAYKGKLLPSTDAATLYAGDVFWLDRAISALLAMNYGKAE